MLKKLPLDLSTFAELQKSNYIYVDKTQYAYNLITGGCRYFLSRPRHFGKSLFVATLKEILDGNKKLFDDLWIGKSNYEWAKHGIISLDFSKIESCSIEDFRASLKIKNLVTPRQKLVRCMMCTGIGFENNIDYTLAIDLRSILSAQKKVIILAEKLLRYCLVLFCLQ